MCVCFRDSAALHRHVQKWSLGSLISLHGCVRRWSKCGVGDLSSVPLRQHWISDAGWATQPYVFLFLCLLNFSDNKVGGCIMFVFVAVCSSVRMSACVYRDFVLLSLLFSQLCNNLSCPHMASLLHVQTQWWVTCSILTLLFSQCLLVRYRLLSLCLTCIYTARNLASSVKDTPH